MKCRLLSLLLLLFGWPVVLRAQEEMELSEQRRVEQSVEMERLWSEGMGEELLSLPLKAYPSVFQQFSDFNFSFVRYQRRGYGYGAERISVQGVDLRDRFSGGYYWNLLSTLQSSLRNELRSEGVTLAEGGVGGVGGSRDYQIEAGALPERFSVGWMSTNRRFRNGFRVAAAMPWSDRGWAYAFSASGRLGRDAFVRGVYSDNWTFSASLAKRLGEKHQLSLSLLGTSMEQGLRGSATAEVFELSGDPLYNPYWGDNSGRVYNARGRRALQPMAILHWRWHLSADWEVVTALAGLWGESSSRSLGWYDAANPYPDYYRYLPSFWGNAAVSNTIRAAWQQGDSRYTQVDWEALWRTNRIDPMEPATYVIGSDVTQHRNYHWTTRFRHPLDVRWVLSGGVQFRKEQALRFRRLEELLGASYLLDVDQYLIDDQYFGDKLQNDMRNPDRRVQEGDRYGYDYDLFQQAVGGWAVLEWLPAASSHWQGYVGVEVAQIRSWREGHYEKELYPGGASLGPSESIHLTEYTLKAGLEFRPRPAHQFSLNISYGDEAPAVDQCFLSADYQNRLVNSISPLHRLGGEAMYRFAHSGWLLTLTGYATLYQGENRLYHYYDDLAGSFTNGVLSGIERLHAGVELSLLVSLASRLDFLGVAAWGRYSYLNDPWVRLYADKSGVQLAPVARAYVKGYALDSSPEQIASAQLRYSGRQLWSASLSVNYVGARAVCLNPLRRTRRVYDYALSPEAQEALLSQERLGDAVTIDLFLSKSFRLGGHFLTLSGSIRNLANRRDVMYSGYESMRLRRTGTGVDQEIVPFPSKYSYAYPRTYYLTINYKF